MLISPYKDDLVDLIQPAETSSALKRYAAGLPSIQLTARQQCDLEMLATGAFSPLTTFMGECDYVSVLDEMRLSDGTVFPIPITLGLDEPNVPEKGSDIALRDLNNDLLAVMTVNEAYEWDRQRFAESVTGTTDLRHPLVAEVQEWGRFNISGPLRVLSLPRYYDFKELRMTPRETRRHLEKLGRPNVVAFQTRNPLHRAHEEMTRRAIAMTGGTLLLQPAVGMTRKGDVDHFTRIRSCREVARAAYPENRVLFAIAPLAMRFAGPREAVWHGIIRRNYGANYFIVGRDHAGPGKDSRGEAFYPPSAAADLAREFSDEIGVKILSFGEMAYCPKRRSYIDTGRNSCKDAIRVSGTSIREQYLSAGQPVPAWLMRANASQILAESHPPLQRQGFCLWFTGLCCSGKSTTAEIVSTLLLEEGRASSLLDGDVVRTHLSKGLGFSKEDRETNLRRIGFVASEIVRHGGVAICATVSPHQSVRDQVRQMFGAENFIEIFVNAPLSVCETRDSKGLYARARRGEIENFTGVTDPYERPRHAEITLDSVNRTPRANALAVIRYLRSNGFLSKGLIQPRKMFTVLQPIGVK